MRPGQKNRMRGGRGNSPSNSRRGPNPLTRSYESNGPDMKVRGTPQHIAEKYVQLARDAHSAGDTVMAESYLQHAEHYYRIIAAAQSVQQAAYNQANGLPNTTPDEVDDEDEFEVAGADRFTFRTPQSFQQPAFQQPGAGFNGQAPGQQSYGDVPGIGDQPSLGGEAQQAEGQPGFQPRPPRPDRPFDNRRPFEDRGGRDRQGRRFGRDRNGGERPFADRANGEGRPGEGRSADGGGSEDQGGPASQPALEEQTGLPSFITAPVRAPGDEAVAPTEEGEARFRNRRRRRPRGADDVAPATVGGDDQD